MPPFIELGRQSYTTFHGATRYGSTISGLGLNNSRSESTHCHDSPSPSIPVAFPIVSSNVNHHA